MPTKLLPLLEVGQTLKMGGTDQLDGSGNTMNINSMNGGKKAVAAGKKGVHYVIEKIDGMPNADLVIKYKNGKKIGQKVMNLDKLKQVSSESIAPHSNKKGTKTKIVFVTPQNAPQQPIVVQKEAGFGTYLMQGFGIGLGLDAAGALFDGLGDAYDGDY
jgi:hypothetical protein